MKASKRQKYIYIDNYRDCKQGTEASRTSTTYAITFSISTSAGVTGQCWRRGSERNAPGDLGDLGGDLRGLRHLGAALEGPQVIDLGEGVAAHLAGGQ